MFLKTIFYKKGVVQQLPKLSVVAFSVALLSVGIGSSFAFLFGFVSLENSKCSTNCDGLS